MDGTIYKQGPSADKKAETSRKIPVKIDVDYEHAYFEGKQLLSVEELTSFRGRRTCIDEFNYCAFCTSRENLRDKLPRSHR